MRRTPLRHRPSKLRKNLSGPLDILESQAYSLDMSNANQSAAMTLTEYTDALAAAVTAAGESARAWHGAHEHRIYRGQDYVEVYRAADGTGGYGSIVGRDRRFGAALSEADRALGNVMITRAAPMAAAVMDATKPQHFGSQFGKCAECGGPTRNGAHVLRRDSSGLSGWCCARCASGPNTNRSFA